MSYTMFNVSPDMLTAASIFSIDSMPPELEVDDLLDHDSNPEWCYMEAGDFRRNPQYVE